MADLTPQQIETMQSNPWFAGLAQGLRESIVAVSRLRVLESGQRLYLRGRPPDGWYGVVRGAIKVGTTTPDGRETVLTWLEPGTWFGEISLLDREPRTHDGYAYRRTEVLVVAPPDFEQLFERHPALLRALLIQQSRRLRILFAMLEESATLPVELRLARQLLAMATTYGRPGSDGTLIDLHLPQDELAQLMGVSRQRINQALKGWERTGALRQRYGRIVIVDPGQLASQAA